MSLSGFQRRRRELAAKEAAKALEVADSLETAEALKATLTTPIEAAKPFSEMTKAELTKYAAAKAIDLGKAKTNAEMIAVIEKHEKG